MAGHVILLCEISAKNHGRVPVRLKWSTNKRFPSFVHIICSHERFDSLSLPITNKKLSRSVKNYQLSLHEVNMDEFLF